ncbi:MAG: FAD-dependent oxidoreductase [Betaproteobacteria bacterium]
MAQHLEVPHHVVLVGGGHSHVEVLRRWARVPPPGARLTVVADRARSVYSGMVPGFVAGQYRLDEIEIDVERMARRAGAEWVEARVTGLDAGARLIRLHGAPPIAYATASFDVGSTVSGLDRPGVRQHALPTRPIAEFVERVDALIERARQRPLFRLVVVGAGAGGVELAFAFRSRFDRLGQPRVSVLLLDQGPRVLPGYPGCAALRIERNAHSRGVGIRCDASVIEAHADHLAMDNGEALACDTLVWVAGSASLPLFDDSGLEHDAQGYINVRATLQAVGHDDIFATGDCANLVNHPGLAKAGVYAVRQGPVLARNLEARVSGRPQREFRPQRDFLSILNLGDGHAIAVKWGICAHGAWTWRLKDAIDRGFVGRFR